MTASQTSEGKGHASRTNEREVAARAVGPSCELIQLQEGSESSLGLQLRSRFGGEDLQRLEITMPSYLQLRELRWPHPSYAGSAGS
jgi:hypothetical protein